MLQIKGHCSYLGRTGYNYHSRNFFRSLFELFPGLKIRNFTVCSNTNEYLSKIDRCILSEQTLFNQNGSRSEYPLNWNNAFLDSDVNGKKIHIILNPENHYYYYDQYNGYKIAYIVWETTELSSSFLNQIKKFDQIWVVSQWHKDNIINQGASSSQVFVVPEALDLDIINEIANINYNNDSFKFLLSGRWEYRKCTKEILETFLETFRNYNNVELLLNADNQFDISGLSVAQKLEKYKLNDQKIKVINFLSRKEYINSLKESRVLLSCSRGEGWNRPLQEAIGMGVPAIFSNYGGQLEFARDLPLKVNVVEQTIDLSLCDRGNQFSGKWCEPNFQHLSEIMMDVYSNYDKYKKIYTEESIKIKNKYHPDRIGLLAQNVLTSTLLKNDKILFVTGGNSEYLSIIEKLVKSFDLFSKNDMVVYGINCDINFDNSKLLKQKINLTQNKESDKWYFKQKICLQSIKDFPEYSKFIWIDGDSIVNKNIDSIESYFKDIENYPIPDRHHLSEYSFFSIDESGNKYDFTYYNEKLIKKFNIPRSSDVLSHACFFLYNKECKWFFEEIISIYEQLKENKEDHIIICNDEGIDNLLRWKYGFDKFLPQSNFETGFNPEYINDFFQKDGPYDFGDSSGWTFIPTDKSKIIYFHGNKKTDVAETIIDLIQTQEFNSNLFYISNEIKIDFSVLELNDTVINIAQKYGWFAAIYHEIYNLHDYDKIKEIEIAFDDIVVDVGANFGAFSRYAIGKGAKKIFAFEPDNRFFNCLEKNLRNSDEIFNCAISNYTGECDLYLTDHVGGATIIVPSDNKIKTPCFTLDYFWDAGLWDKIDLLKIDTEGAEHNIFKGISDCNLKKIKKITLEYHNCFWNNDDNKRIAFVQRFINLGFNTYTLFLGHDNKLQMLYLWQ